MRYKIAHSETDRYVVYRKFTYKRNKYLGIQGFLSVSLLSIGIFLTMPTPEDIIVLGAIGKYLSKVFDMTTGQGVLYATLAYKGTGVALIVVAAAFGGSYIRNRLKAQVKNTAAKAVKYLNYVI